MFNHILNKFQFPQLQETKVDGKRFYQVDGELFPSVTTVLSAQENEGLIRWRENLGEDVANFEMRRAANRGKIFHSIVEDYLNNRSIQNYKSKVLSFGLFSLVKKEFEKELISSVIDYCKNKCYFIDFFCTGNFYETELKKLGFFNNNHKKLKIPSVFNPISTKRRPEINFLYADLLNNTKKNILDQENNWYFVKSDSDQDRAY